MRGAHAKGLAVALAGGLACLAGAAEDCGRLDLDAASVEEPPAQYSDFCVRSPEECDRDGAGRFAWTAATAEMVVRVNAAVNAEVRLSSEQACHGREEFWSLPAEGYGDCEDFALEKRRRLAEEGLPRAAISMAIVHHRVGLFPHAVLMLETDDGVFVLDNLAEAPVCWRDASYAIEQVEGPGVMWTRFVR